MIRIIIVLLFFAQLKIAAQLVAEKTSIDSGGTLTNVNTLQCISTVGETYVFEITVGNLNISEGFISPSMLISLGYKDYLPLLDVKIFPNPTQDFVQVVLKEKKDYTLTLYDMGGKIIKQLNEYTSEFELEVLELPTASYWLILTDNQSRQLESIQLIKN